MFPPRIPPPLRAASAASGDFDPESPRRNSQTGEIGPAPVVGTFAPPPIPMPRTNPLFNAPVGQYPSRLPPPPPRATLGGSQELPPPGGFQRPSGLPQPGFLAGLPMPSVPRSSSWPMNVPNTEGGMGNSFGSSGQNRPRSNAPSPTVLSPTQANLMMGMDEAPSAVIQVSQPTVGLPYAPQRNGTGSPSMMAAAQQYAAAYQQQQEQHQHHHQQQQKYAEQHNMQQGNEYQNTAAETAAAPAGEWMQEPDEMAQMYNDTNTGYGAQGGGYNEGGYNESGYNEAAAVPEAAEMMPTQQYNEQQYNDNQYYEQQQYYSDQQYNQGQQQYDENAVAGGGEDAGMAAAYNGVGNDGAGGEGHAGEVDHSKMAGFASRKLPPPAVSTESPIKARFARGAGHSSARAGALAGAFNKAAAGFPPPPLSSVPQIPAPPADGTERYNAGMNDGHTMMPSFPSGGFADSSVASAPAGDEAGGEVEQLGEAAAPASASLPPLPPPMMGAPGMGGNSFPTYGNHKPMLPRHDSNAQSQPGSARSNGSGVGPPQFGGGGGGIVSAGSGVFMPTRGSMDALNAGQAGVYKPSNMVPGAGNLHHGGSGGSGNFAAAATDARDSSRLGQQQEQQQHEQKEKQHGNKHRKQKRRGICSVLFLLSLVLTISAALSVGTTIVAITFAANLTHAAITGLGSMAYGASLSSAIEKMHPAANGIAKHVDLVSQAQWRATDKSLKCDESKVMCRGARWALHSARVGGILTKDAAVATVSRAPHVLKQSALPTVHFTKQQSVLLFDQLKGMKTSEGRGALAAAVHQSVAEVQKLGHDVFLWMQCVYQHLSQSGVHSISHLVEPAAGCWAEIMGPYYLPAGTGTVANDVGDAAAHVGVDEVVENLETEVKNSISSDVGVEETTMGREEEEVVVDEMDEGKEFTAPVEKIEKEDEKEEEEIVEKEPAKMEEEIQQEDEIPPVEVPVGETKHQDEVVQQEEQGSSSSPAAAAAAAAPPATAAPSPLLLEEEEEEEEIEEEVAKIEVEQEEKVEETPSVAEIPAAVPSSSPTEVEVQKSEEAGQLEEKEAVQEEEKEADVDIPEKNNDTNNATATVSPIVEEEEVKETPPSPAVHNAAVVPEAVEEKPIEELQQQQQQQQQEVIKEEQITTPEAPVVVDTVPVNAPASSNELPERYASEEEYMNHGEIPGAVEVQAVVKEVVGDGDGGDHGDVVKEEVDQGPPGASIISQTTPESVTQTKQPLGPILVAKMQELKHAIAGVVSRAAESMKEHQASIVAALGAAGSTAILFFAKNTLDSRKAALAARLAAGGAGAIQPVTPRQPSAGRSEDQAPATVFKSARSGRKTQTVVTTEEDIEEEGVGVVKKRGRQSAPARITAPAVEREGGGGAGAAEVEETRGRKSSRGGASRGRSRSRVGAAATTTTSRGGRKPSVSRRRSTKTTA